VAARALAAALQCERPDNLGCGECSACHTVLSRSHPDVRSVVPDGLSISVAEMRAVVATAARRPALGRWQVVVIEDADRLTEAASDALLKVLEEPPARTVFLLCAPSTHPDDVTVTIQSRCRHITLRTPSTDAVAGVVRAAGVDPADALWAAQAAQGHVGRAKRLARDPDARTRRAAVLAIPASLTSLGHVWRLLTTWSARLRLRQRRCRLIGTPVRSRHCRSLSAPVARGRCDGSGPGRGRAPFVTSSGASGRGPPVLSVMRWIGP
jgi:DNA polymerase-3 subunit delta'